MNWVLLFSDKRSLSLLLDARRPAAKAENRSLTRSGLWDCGVDCGFSDNLGLVPPSRELATAARLQGHLNLKAEIEKWGVPLKKAGVQLD